ncbi:acid-shock protein [Methylovulum psychrotolerans]|uniref:Acid-shock protein n=1 Tax=Methylovulum psychrotolerans TaxID=1704499 RepID=A0A2S5CL02_9GAMM|nr:acid-shock protein [Methylovulum psychrotolerans]POZ51491.1 acid-shock protein [Methylovulum psychrotolerans]
MTKNIYLGLALAICMGVMSASVLAEVIPAPVQPEQITAPATTPVEHKAAAELNLKHAQYYKGLAKHHRSVGAVYQSNGQRILGDRQEAIAVHEDALAKEYEQTAAEHEKVANPK